MITWSKSTKPCPIITWDGVVFNGEHHYVDHIYYMIHARPFGLSVPRPLHMLDSSSLTWVFCVCKTGLHPLYVNVELITPDNHVVSQHEELSQRCLLRDNTYTLKFSEGSSYNATNTSPTYLLFLTLFILFWTLICMIWMELTWTDAVFSRITMVLFMCRNKSSRNDLKLHGTSFWK